MSKFRSRDGDWTVEAMTLSHTAAPNRPGDPDGDGAYLLVRYCGRAWHYCRTPSQVAEFVPLADLIPYDGPEREWHDICSLPRRRA